MLVGCVGIGMAEVTECSSESVGNVSKLVFLFSVHAPLLKRYNMGSDGFESVGEKSEYGRCDPSSGAEYRALGGTDHRYNKDYKIGPSYGETMFVYGADEKNNAVSHEVLEGALKERGEWTDAFAPIIMPNGSKYGEWTWWNGFQVRPPERCPSSISRVVSQLENEYGEDRVLYLGGNSVEVYFPVE